MHAANSEGVRANYGDMLSSASSTTERLIADCKGNNFCVKSNGICIWRIKR